MIAAFPTRRRCFLASSLPRSDNLITHRFQGQTAELRAVTLLVDFLRVEDSFSLRNGVIAKADTDDVETVYPLLRQL